MKDYFKLTKESFSEKQVVKNFMTNKSFGLIENQTKFLSGKKVYCFLKNVYGKPNGYQEGDDKNIKIWEWIFKTDYGSISCYGYNDDWLIGYRGKFSQDLEKEAIKLSDQLLSKIFRVNLKRIKDKYEADFGILENPFYFYQNVIDSLRIVFQSDQQTNYDLENKSNLNNLSNDLIKEKDFFKINRNILFIIFINYLFLFEAFLNLILFFFLKQNFRQDERLRLNIENEKIDIKLKMLDDYCFCFKEKPFNEEDNLYKAYMYLVGLRNSFIHGDIVEFKNIALKNSKFFFPAKKIDQFKYDIPHNPRIFNEKAIGNTKIIIDGLIFRIINSMADHYKNRFGLVYDWPTIQYKIYQNNIYLTSVIIKNEGDFQLHISDKNLEKELQKLNKFKTFLKKYEE